MLYASQRKTQSSGKEYSRTGACISYYDTIDGVIGCTCPKRKTPWIPIPWRPTKSYDRDINYSSHVQAYLTQRSTRRISFPTTQGVSITLTVLYLAAFSVSDLPALSSPVISHFKSLFTHEMTLCSICDQVASRGNDRSSDRGTDALA